METIKPKVLTSILPFGISLNEKGKKCYRFSLCVDLSSAYSVGEVPDHESLKRFLRNYGIKKTSIFQTIIEKVGIEVMLHGRNIPIAWKACFPASFNTDTVDWHWELLLKGVEQSVAPGSDLTGNEEHLGGFTHNPLMGKTVVQFQKAEDPSSIYRSLVIEQEKLHISAVGTAKADPAKMGTQVKGLFQTVRGEFEGLAEDIKQTDRLLKGIGNFAVPKNSVQAEIYRKRKRAGFTEDLLSSPDSIMEVMAFINTNVILQRLFGTTIDFEIEHDELGLGSVGDGSFDFTINATDKDQDLPNYLEWTHLTTEMVHHQKGLGSAVTVARKDARSPYFTANYDFGAKLRSLNDLDQKIGGIKAKLNAAKSESEFHAIRKELIALDSAALTRGMNLYSKDVEAEYNEILKMDLKLASPAQERLTEEHVTRGCRFGVRSQNENSTEIMSLGSRVVTLKEKSVPALPEEFVKQDFAVHNDTGAHALIETTTGSPSEVSVHVEYKVVVDNALLTWSGQNIGMPSVFSNVENDENFEAKESEGSTSTPTDIVTKVFSKIFKEEFFPKSVIYGVDNSRGSKEMDESTDKDISLQYRFDTNAKLLFGRTYFVCCVPEFKNGWAVRFNRNDITSDHTLHELGYGDLPDATFIEFKFKRNEPVKPICFYLQDPLVEPVPGRVGDHTPVEGRNGESLHHLVIRNYGKDNDADYRTKQKSVRHILPPAISFEQAFWHGKIFEIHREYGKNESHRWYKRHHFPVNEGERKPNGSGTYTYEDSIDGSTRMREFYPDRLLVPDSWEQDDIINYLPDPLSKGFRLEFYLDKGYTIRASDYEKFEENEYYFSGKYPRINAWKLIVEDEDDKLVEVNGEEIHVRIRRGNELFIRARTILDDAYEDEFETFGCYNEFTKYGTNSLLCPPLEFSVAHAMQRPLVRPTINNTLDCKKEIGKSFVSMTNTINLEQLGIYKDEGGIVRYLDGVMPTGRVELYAKWEEYVDDPRHQTVDDWTPHEPVNKVDLSTFYHKPGESPASFEAAIELSDAQVAQMERTLNRISDDNSDYKNYAVDITAEYDIKDTKFIEKWYWIKNKSKFTQYYPKKWGTDEDSDANRETTSTREVFNKTSVNPFLIRILNNKKPGKPVIADRNITLVSVTEDLQDKNGAITRTNRIRRLRFYFERGRLTSGKNERIGFVLNEPKNPYNDYLVTNNLISTVGRDIVSDAIKPYDGLFRNEAVLLNKGNFIIHDPFDLETFKDGEKAEDLERFRPEYVEDLGIMTYIPLFDKGLNVWYLDVELDINDKYGKELHSPFLQFGLVHYQKHSFNYNKPGENNPEIDCRISEVFKSGFTYLLGSRVIYVDKVSSKEVRIKVSADETSLVSKHSLNKLCTRFFAFIERRGSDDISWQSMRTEGQSEVVPLDNKRMASLKYDRDWSRSKYRVVLLETEYFGPREGPTPVNREQIHDNEDYRIVLVSTLEL